MQAQPTRSKPSPAQKWWARVQQRGSCWEWKAGKSRRGYGRFWDDGVVQAHRFAYELLIGPIPDGQEIDHLCGNTGCVNPDHLEAVPPRENLVRALIRHGRFYGDEFMLEDGCCLRGHPYEGDNLYVEPKTGARRCRICRREDDRRRYARQRAAKSASS